MPWGLRKTWVHLSALLFRAGQRDVWPCGTSSSLLSWICFILAPFPFLWRGRLVGWLAGISPLHMWPPVGILGRDRVAMLIPGAALQIVLTEVRSFHPPEFGQGTAGTKWLRHFQMSH